MIFYIFYIDITLGIIDFYQYYKMSVIHFIRYYMLYFFVYKVDVFIVVFSPA